MLNQDQIKGKWTEIKGGVRNLWGKITDDELEQTKGDLTSIAGIVRQKYGEKKEDIQGKLDRLFDSFENDQDKGKTPPESSYMRNPTSERYDSKEIYEDGPKEGHKH